MTYNKKNFDNYNLEAKQFIKIQKYINEIIIFNKHTNIVGRSTLVDPWNDHVLDSIQICNFIKNKKKTILDMGTGAGMPGLILAINNYQKVSVIDSNYKKIKFINYVCNKLNINVKIYHQRVETLLNMKFDYIISRAMCNLNKLCLYSYRLINKKTVLIFLKGKNVNKELQEALKNWSFYYDIYQSFSDKRGKIIVIKDLVKNSA